MSRRPSKLGEIEEHLAEVAHTAGASICLQLQVPHALAGFFGPLEEFGSCTTGAGPAFGLLHPPRRRRRSLKEGGNQGNMGAPSRPADTSAAGRRPPSRACPSLLVAGLLGNGDASREFVGRTEGQPFLFLVRRGVQRAVRSYGKGRRGGYRFQCMVRVIQTNSIDYGNKNRRPSMANRELSAQFLWQSDIKSNKQTGAGKLPQPLRECPCSPS